MSCPGCGRDNGIFDVHVDSKKGYNVFRHRLCVCGAVIKE